MTEQEVKEAFQELKDEGLEDEDIVKALGAMFENDEIDKNQLEALLHELGYEFTPDFAKLEGDEAKSGLWKEGEDELAEGVDKDEVEESGEDEAPNAPVEKKDSEDDEKEDSEDKEESEEDEKDKALKLMGL